MFDFAISHNQRQKPTARFFVSAAVSCILHLLMLVVLIENPWILKGGIYRHFRGLVLSIDKTSEPTPDTEDENYRVIAVLRPMTAPSPDTLNKLIYDWDNPPKEEDEPAARTRWGNDEKTALDEDIKISSTIETEPAPAPAGSEDASDLAGSLEDTVSEPAGTAEAPSSESAGVVLETGDKKEAMTPVEESSIEEDVALNVAPARIPDTIPPPEKTRAPEDIKIFENEQQAIDSRGESGIFGGQGWPLKEYASMIKQRVTERWLIPSNLRDMEGHITIVFFIDRNGQNFDARIVESSGNHSLDTTALSAIIRSNPFPPLPQGFPGDHIGVKYIFIREPQ
ncbi:MAG: TonB family protein [Acidobacteriota bacterium]|jgi:TonB family protein